MRKHPSTKVPSGRRPLGTSTCFFAGLLFYFFIETLRFLRHQIHTRFYKGWHTVHRPSGRGVSRQMVFWGFLATLSPISRSVWGCVRRQMGHLETRALPQGSGGAVTHRDRGVTQRDGRPAGIPPIHMRFYKGWHTVHRPSGRGVSRQMVFWGGSRHAGSDFEVRLGCVRHQMGHLVTQALPQGSGGAVTQCDRGA